MRTLALIMVLSALLPKASAQRMTPRLPNSPPVGYHRAFLDPIPYFTDSWYTDALRPAPAASPTVVVMQAPPTESTPERVSPPAEPLVIELHGGRYVRLSGTETLGIEMLDQESASTQVASAASRKSVAAREAVPAVLVFRDGHREEVSEYTIADGVLYARRNYYIDGAWNRKIDLSSLNLVETVNANRSRGVKFQLPAAENEVIVGP